MEMEDLIERENVFLGRKELEFKVRHENATPSKADIVKELAARYSVSEEHVILNFIITRKGTHTAFVKAKIYKEKPVVKVKVKKAEGQAQPKQETKKA